MQLLVFIDKIASCHVCAIILLSRLLLSGILRFVAGATTLENGMTIELKPDVTPEQLAVSLRYDPVTGAFTWKKRMGSTPAGTPAGTVYKGIRYIAVVRKPMKAVMLANYLMTGTWKRMKQLDGDKSNMSWANLAPADDLAPPLKRYIQCFETDYGWEVISNVDLEFQNALRIKLAGLMK